jgi:serine-type D-Ala-D-Ala carboxypeptidase (penicillin-binding protein 5/6)
MGRILAVIVIVLAAVAYVVVQLVRPVPPVQASGVTLTPTMPGTPVSLGWPAQGQAAVGVEGTGLLAQDGPQTETPLASVTKLMTAYLVLRDHPLAKTASGPNVTVTPTDVTTYETDQAQGDSVVAVTPGEQLNELQLLEALLIPSGDNIATLLAVWDAGSEQAFVAKMNATARQLGLRDTHYADASGVTPSTESTAAAQVRLAMADMAMPAFRAVVAMPQATLPVAGVVYNVDAELGKDGIIGVKTGYTTQAGGCFVFAATTKVDGRTRTVVGAVLHQEATATQPSPLTAAFDASSALLTSTEHGLEQDTVVRSGEVLGHIRAPWGPSVALKATRSVTLIGLAGARVRTAVDVPATVTPPVADSQRLGSAVVQLGDQRVTVPLATSGTLPGASLSWRLTDI